MISDDPVLRDFFHSPQHADISGPWRPGSIRDQSVRASLIVDRALRHGWIAKDRPLAIAGAGVAGVTAAVMARRHDVPVTLFESRKPLVVQSESFRWIDPAAYDWPHTWWADGHFPLSLDACPIRIEAGEGRAIALQFADLLHRDPEIKVVRSEIAEIQPVIEHGGFHLVADCRGVKAERHRSGDFVSPPFWDRRDPRWIVAEAAGRLGRPPRVLISGGGDGAIQDFLLLATGVRSVVELAQAVGLSTAPSPGSKLDLAAFEREALSIEDRCWRGLCWCDSGDSHEERQSCAALDRFYRGWMDRLNLSRLPDNPIDCEFTLVRRTNHASVCYPLNRMLAIFAEEQYKPRFAANLDHLNPKDFDVVVIRHGVETEPGQWMVTRRQALPYVFSGPSIDC